MQTKTYISKDVWIWDGYLTYSLQIRNVPIKEYLTDDGFMPKLLFFSPIKLYLCRTDFKSVFTFSIKNEKSEDKKIIIKNVSWFLTLTTRDYNSKNKFTSADWSLEVHKLNFSTNVIFEIC